MPEFQDHLSQARHLGHAGLGYLERIGAVVGSTSETDPPSFSTMMGYPLNDFITTDLLPPMADGIVGKSDQLKGTSHCSHATEKKAKGVEEFLSNRLTVGGIFFGLPQYSLTASQHILHSANS